jgi:hypothetical protein
MDGARCTVQLGPAVTGFPSTQSILSMHILRVVRSGSQA